jgi:predicted transposase/invertase (TIGR01784 family)
MTKKLRVLISFDYALKRLLRNKANYDVLAGFLSELLMQDVKVRSIAESESNKTCRVDKQNRVDIMVEDAKGEIIIIELQFEVEFDYLQRMLFGAGKAVTEYMNQGDGYMNVRKVYAIHVVYFNLGQGEDYVYHGRTTFRGLHRQDELRLSEAQQKLFARETAGDLYPEYYILKVNRFNEKAKDKLDEWIYFLKTNTIKEEFTARGLKKAREVLSYEQLTDEERAEYDALQSERSHKLSMIASAKDEERFEYESIIAAERKARAAERKAERKALAEKDAALAEKDAALAAERKALARARAELAALKKEKEKK